jgi:hypothetical protein
MKSKIFRRQNKITLDLGILEKANNAIRNAFYINEWSNIHRGNDCY